VAGVRPRAPAKWLRLIYNMAISTIIFDLDDTLTPDEEIADEAILKTIDPVVLKYNIDPEEMRLTVRQTCRAIWYASPLHDYCAFIGISSWEGMWADFRGDSDCLRKLYDWAPEYRKQSWHDSLRKFNVDDEALAVRLIDDFIYIRRQMFRTYDDVPSVLGDLKGKYKLGLLTNGAPRLQREKIDGTKVGGYFDEIVISGDVGVGKPNPKIFDFTLQRLGAKVDETIMVGNSLSSDIAGGKAAGIKAAWLNRNGEKRENNIVPDWEITGLRELYPILR
jgi:putative hydrolase of the HAD superfamily